MMMIALRGPIRRAPQTSSPPLPSPPKPTTAAGEWIWTGIWAFGTLPAPTPAELAGSRRPNSSITSINTSGGNSAGKSVSGSKKRRSSSSGALASAVGARPFVYKFFDVADPATVSVPSSYINPKSDTPDHADDYQNDNDDNDRKQQFERKEQSGIGGDGTKNVVADEAFQFDRNKDPAVQTPQNLFINVRQSPPVHNAEKSRNEKPLQPSNSTENPVNSINDESAAINITTGDTVKNQGESQLKKRDQSENEGNGNQIGSDTPKITFATTAKGETFVDAGEKYPTQCPVGGCWKGYFENVTKRKDRNSSRVQETFYLFFNATPPSDARLTFAGDDEGDNDNKESEEIRLTKTNVDTIVKNELDDNLAVPLTDQGKVKESTRESKGRLSEGHVHVRGMGTNLFGTFEIIGSYNLDTGFLQCQRMYVLTTDGSVAPASSGRSKKSATVPLSTPSRTVTRDKPSKTRRTSFEVLSPSPGGGISGGSGGGSSDATPGKRSYYTRKIQMSWKRPGYGSDSDDDDASRKSAGSTTPNSAKKRARSISEGMSTRTASAQQAGTNLSSVTAAPAITDAGCNTSGNGDFTSPLPKRSLSSNLLESPLTVGMEAAKSVAAVDNSAEQLSEMHKQTPCDSLPCLSMASSMLPSGGGLAGAASKKPKLYANTVGGDIAKAGIGKGSLSPSNNAASMQLPSAGEARDARWRAAHFMYFLKSVNPVSPQEVTSGSGAAQSLPTAAAASSARTTTSYVVYEGEMNNGNNMREGRGVCLYNNGTIYEGQWKRNKEHGRGKLVTENRERVIYDGDWERGRMHGKGKYYYYTYNSNYDDNCGDDFDDNNGGVYDGDFKENARHGFGIYTMADGSIYDGEWRENVPSGKGTFKWVDGSFYIGQWKDGKRHGQGTLRTSDNFSYEGMWVSNAMEGRGMAIYPSGQRYEGMWAGGKREGRGTIKFTNGAVYEGRFRDDCMEGQGTLKMTQNAVVPHVTNVSDPNDAVFGDDHPKVDSKEQSTVKDDWMIPIEFQSDIRHIHQKAGFTTGGE